PATPHTPPRPTPARPPERPAPSLHDALPICRRIHVDPITIPWREPDIRKGELDDLRTGRGGVAHVGSSDSGVEHLDRHEEPVRVDRKSTRLNSSHVKISYAVFCLKEKRRRRA